MTGAAPPPAGRVVGVPRAAWRVAAALACALHGALLCAAVFPFVGPAARSATVGAWSRRMLRAFGIGVDASGERWPAPVLLVANHVSWLDILALNAVAGPVRFVSKAEVRRWPLLGWMVAASGTLFIERGARRDALRVVHRVAERLRAGDAVAIFPEGTTGDGHGLLPFHANLLQAAVATGVPVQPVALRYADRFAPVSAAVAWIGDLGLAQSVWRVARAERLAVGVRLLVPVDPAGLDRRALARVLAERIGRELARSAS